MSCLKRFIRNLSPDALRNYRKAEYQEIKLIRTKKELESFTEKYLTKLILHSYQNVKYYKSIFDEIGLIKNDKVDLGRFEEIPLLNKKIIRENKNQIISMDHFKRRYYQNSTGGSTGSPLSFMQDDIYSRWGSATFYYWHKEILGIDEPNVRKAILWGSQRDIYSSNNEWRTDLRNWLHNTIFLNSLVMTEENMNNYIHLINSYKPTIIRGYAGSLFELASYIKRKNIKIHQPKIVISAAEVLTDIRREKIETTFGTRAFDFYGSRETNNLAGECKHGSMHIFSFHNYIELLNDNDEPTKDGDVGRIVVTNLHNYSMPFIRYEIEDLAFRRSAICDCGSPLPCLGKIIGKINYRFLKGDGTIVDGGIFEFLFDHTEWINAFKVIQENYKKISILIVPIGNIDELEKIEIEDKIKHVMGQDCEVLWKIVAEIPLSPQGKHIFIESLIKN